MADAGFKFNLKKCKLVEPRCIVLGYEVFNNQYQLADKCLKKWLT